MQQSICFAESDSHYLNVRIIIIPSNLKHQFFKLSIFHERISNKNVNNVSSRGLLNYLTSSFPTKDYKIWRSSSLVFEHRRSGKETYCNGKLSLFLEVKQPFLESQVDTHQKNIELLLSSLDEKSAKPATLDDVKIKYRCEKIYPDLLKRYFKLNDDELNIRSHDMEIRRKIIYDVFISYSTKDAERAKELRKRFESKKFGVKVFMDDDNMRGGHELSEYILDGFLHSRELWLLISKDSLSSRWVTTEWGLAWALKMFVVPVLINMNYEEFKEKGDTRLTGKKSIPYPVKLQKFDNYAREVLSRRFESMLYSDQYFY